MKDIVQHILVILLICMTIKYILNENEKVNNQENLSMTPYKFVEHMVDMNKYDDANLYNKSLENPSNNQFINGYGNVSKYSNSTDPVDKVEEDDFVRGHITDKIDKFNKEKVETEFETEFDKKIYEDLTKEIERKRGQADMVDKFDKNLCSNLVTPYRKKTEVGCTNDADCNNGTYGKNTCGEDNRCQCIDGKGTFCQNQKRNYPDPKDMTPAQIAKYKQTYHQNMTRQDYTSWLLLFRSTLQHLHKIHQNNLIHIIDGDNLSKRDIPKYIKKDALQKEMILTGEQYFKRLYPDNSLELTIFDKKIDTTKVIGYDYLKNIAYIQPDLLGKTSYTHAKKPEMQEHYKQFANF
jgi:hypothetical protein